MLRVVVFGVPLLAAGCSRHVEFPDPTTEFTVDCTGSEAFLAGMERTALLEDGTTGSTTVRLAAATPAPPDVDDNDWVIELVNDQGQPVVGRSVEVEPFMPLHGHGLNPARYVGNENADGRYVVDTFDLIMPGLWEFTVLVDEGAEQATFAFCAEG